MGALSTFQMHLEPGDLVKRRFAPGRGYSFLRNMPSIEEDGLVVCHFKNNETAIVIATCLKNEEYSFVFRNTNFVFLLCKEGIGWISVYNLTLA